MLTNKIFVIVVVTALICLSAIEANPKGLRALEPKMENNDKNNVNGPFNNGMQRDFGCNGPMDRNDAICDKHCKDINVLIY